MTEIRAHRRLPLVSAEPYAATNSSGQPWPLPKTRVRASAAGTAARIGASTDSTPEPHRGKSLSWTESVSGVQEGQNRRIGKKVNGVLVEGFLYRNQLQPVAWLNGDGTVRARFVYGGKPNVPEYMVTSAGTTYRLITDQVGSVRVVIDSTGTVADQIDYDNFGNLLSDSSPGFQPFGFAGGLRDVDTGLLRFGARDLQPTTGRWTTKDPIAFGGQQGNLYLYVGSDPINRIDPLGLLTWWDVANGVVGFGDGVSFGLTVWIRDRMGTNGVMDRCSNTYTVGRYSGYAWAVATLWVAGLNGGSNSVFWAGRGAAAEAATMGTTIAQTPIGSLLVSVGVENRVIWAIASATFAGNASGTATAVIRYVAPTSLWLLENTILNFRNIPIIYR